MMPKLRPRLLYPALLPWLMLWCCAGVWSAAEPTPYQKIELAFQSGQISYTDKLVDQMTAFFAPQNVSAQFKSATPTMLKSGTGLVMEVLAGWDQFTPQQQALLSQYLARPDIQKQYDSPSGLFKIHYDTAGPEVVPLQDDDNDSVPDYVERIAVYCDSAYATFVNHLGYYPAPTDNLAGGDDKYDVYLMAIAGYGVTYPDRPGDSAWNDFTSYIGIHNNFYFPLNPNDDPEGDSIGAQKVTSAHEYFHAVQLAYEYDFSDNHWLMELSSTWMEEVVFSGVNDNYAYLPSFFRYPEKAITSTSDIYHMYGAFVWAAFLQQKFGPAVMRNIWSYCRYRSSLDAIDSAVAPFGTNVKHLFPEFSVWNYFTGTRAIPGQYYTDAADYPAIDVDLIFDTPDHDSIQPLHAPEGFGCNYIRLTVDSAARGNLELELRGAELVRWTLTDIGITATDHTVESIWSDNSFPLRLYIPYIDAYSEVIAVPSVSTRYAPGSNYYLSSSVLPAGDANDDGEVNVGDITYLINFVFRSGPLPKPVAAAGDANCDHQVNIADAVLLITYVFRGGEAPCSGGSR
jgi:hypothetical protein